MPIFHLHEEDARAVVAYLKSLPHKRVRDRCSAMSSGRLRSPELYAPAKDVAKNLHYEFELPLVHSLLQRFDSVAPLNQDPRLGQDRPGVVFRIYNVDRHATFAVTGSQHGLVDPMAIHALAAEFRVVAYDCVDFR